MFVDFNSSPIYPEMIFYLYCLYIFYLLIVLKIIVSLQIQWLHPCEQVVAGLDRRSETKLRRRLIS